MYAHHFGGIRRLAQRVADYQLGKISGAQLIERYVPEGRPRRPISPKLRLAVLERDGFCCRLCGRSAKTHGIALEVDHIEPVAKGGSCEITNLQTLCEDCNAGKRDSLVNGV
jgi:5-methylcytosine-specific restriction endonuclease McrA